MQLKYRILWVEDDEDWYESITDSIINVVESFGFIPDIKRISKKEEGEAYSGYDLILMDYNLEDGSRGYTGEKLISLIRSLKVLTDVVFYSAKGPATIKKKAAENNLEGVYFSDRDKTQFVEKVSLVIQSTIKKVQDLNNLRGLVMAEVSEMDAEMDQIIKAYFCTSDRMKLFHRKITKNREKSVKKDLVDGENCDKTCKLKWHDQTVDKIPTDSSQKSHAIHEILTIEDNDGALYHKGQFMEDYVRDIIKVRNELAHSKSELDADGNEILKTLDGDKTFSESDFKTIRINIQRYRNLFAKIRKNLNI